MDDQFGAHRVKIQMPERGQDSGAVDSEEPVEQVGAVGLVVLFGVVALVLQGGPEPDAGGPWHSGR